MINFKPIRYDKKAEKEWLIKLILSGVVILLFFGVLLTDAVSASVSSAFFESDAFLIFVMIVCTASYIAIPVFVVSLLKFIDAHIYLKRLAKNTYTLPEDKKQYEKNLFRLPKKEAVENAYARDSRIGGMLFLIGYIAFVIADFCYGVKWFSLGETDAIVFFIPMMAVHLFYLFFAVTLFGQRNTEKYVDEVDIGDSRKTRFSLPKALTVFVLTAVLFVVGLMLAHSMTKYVYKSRHSSFDHGIESFKESADMTVTSEDLIDGRWSDVVTNTEKGENLSPQLSFDQVEGADYYYIYMVDETANYWAHWVADEVRENVLATGANQAEYKDNNAFQYVGPYPPAGSGEHTYTVYVFAMKAKPDCDLQPTFDAPSFSGDVLYYDCLSVSKRGDPDVYGNVISYGYISGTYKR